MFWGVILINGDKAWNGDNLKVGTICCSTLKSLQIEVLSKSHATIVWGPRNLSKDWRSWGRFRRSPNSLCMGFTFLMDANTSKYFYNYFMGVKQTLISHWKMKKKSLDWEISFTFSWYLKISLQLFYGNEANSNKPLKSLKNLWD